ncbi:unnamed protein product [Calypogeia fissa]
MKFSIVFPLGLTFMAAAFIFTASACSVISNVEITFYGYPDNSPPGAAIAYDCGRGYTAGGTGTYSDPLTMATAAGEYSTCEVVYLPYLEKYLTYEDECSQCVSDWSSGVAHIDVWTGSRTVDGGQTQLDCENALTPNNNQGVLRQPSSNLAVNTAALFTNGNCNTGTTYPNNNANC